MYTSNKNKTGSGSPTLKCSKWLTTLETKAEEKTGKKRQGGVSREGSPFTAAAHRHLIPCAPAWLGEEQSPGYLSTYTTGGYWRSSAAGLGPVEFHFSLSPCLQFFVGRPFFASKVDVPRFLSSCCKCIRKKHACVCAQAYTNTNAHAGRQAGTHARTHAHTHTRTHTHTHARVHVCTHAHTHAHSLTRSVNLEHTHAHARTHARNREDDAKDC